MAKTRAKPSLLGTAAKLGLDIAAMTVAGTGARGQVDREKIREFKRALMEEMFGGSKEVAALMATVVAPVGAVIPKTPLIAAVPPSSNVVGVGFGAKVTDGTVAEAAAVRVYVKVKYPRSKSAPSSCQAMLMGCRRM